MPYRFNFFKSKYKFLVFYDLSISFASEDLTNNANILAELTYDWQTT